VEVKFTVLGNLPTLNEYTGANRRNRYAGASMKANAEKLIAHYLKLQGVPSIDKPFKLSVDWYEKDLKKDFDNVVFAQKFLLDSMVENKVIPNDSRRYFSQMEHRIFVDKENPRIEVTLLVV
jgi:Holliday junction resolvase RusA-like endonuclease